MVFQTGGVSLQNIQSGTLSMNPCSHIKYERTHNHSISVTSEILWPKSPDPRMVRQCMGLVVVAAVLLGNFMDGEELAFRLAGRVTHSDKLKSALQRARALRRTRLPRRNETHLQIATRNKREAVRMDDEIPLPGHKRKQPRGSGGWKKWSAHAFLRAAFAEAQLTATAASLQFSVGDKHGSHSHVGTCKKAAAQVLWQQQNEMLQNALDTKPDFVVMTLMWDESELKCSAIHNSRLECPLFNSILVSHGSVALRFSNGAQLEEPFIPRLACLQSKCANLFRTKPPRTNSQGTADFVG